MLTRDDAGTHSGLVWLHFVLGFQSTLCASAGFILIGLLSRKD